MMDRNVIIDQLKKDEGYTPIAKWDVKQASYGYGCRAPAVGAHISEVNATILLGQRVDEAMADFLNIFAGHIQKFNDVRSNAFINMIFNMGPGQKGHPEVGGLQSFVHTLGLIFRNDPVPWDDVADNLMMSKWYSQIKNSGDPPGRGHRIVAEVRTGVIA